MKKKIYTKQELFIKMQKEANINLKILYEIERRRKQHAA